MTRDEHGRFLPVVQEAREAQALDRLPALCDECRYLRPQPRREFNRCAAFGLRYIWRGDDPAPGDLNYNGDCPRWTPLPPARHRLEMFAGAGIGATITTVIVILLSIL